MEFEIVGTLVGIQVIATGSSIRELPRLVRRYGAGRRRKLKGHGVVRLPNGTMRTAELHWYEAHGVGRVEFKIKRVVPST